MTTEDRPEDIAHPALHGTRILKHDAMFAVFDVWGDMVPRSGDPSGLFFNDTRILSTWSLSSPQILFKFLSGGIDDDLNLFSSHLTNDAFTDASDRKVREDTLHIHRQIFLYGGAMYERISVANFGSAAADFSLSLSFAADFRDLFEVRGMARSQRGVISDPTLSDRSYEVSYRGLDAVERRLTIVFSRKGRIDGTTAHFPLSLAPQESWDLIAVAECGPCSRPYDEALAALRAECADKKSLWDITRTGDSSLDAWAISSARAIDFLTTNYETGPYPCAGTPWFSVPFGRDGIITAFQTLPFNPSLAKSVLTYLAKHQATDYSAEHESQPGKILHETRACEMANTGEVAFAKYYGSVDATPLFLMLAGAYFELTKDIDFIRSIEPALGLALRWLETDADADGDGFIEYIRQNDKGLATQGWKDSHDSIFHADGTDAAPPIALCEVQGYAYAAFRSMSALMDAFGDRAEADRLSYKAATLYARFNDTFWNDEDNFYALALDRDKNPCRVRASNMGHLLWCGIVPDDRAHAVIDLLTSDNFFTGWGIRTVAKDESRYNPLSYHNGSVWPHDTAIAAQGFARYGRVVEAKKILDGLHALARRTDGMILPELICGFTNDGQNPVSYPTACAPQAWASGAFFMAASAAGLFTKNR